MTRDISISASSAFFWWKMQKIIQLIDNQSFTSPTHIRIRRAIYACTHHLKFIVSSPTINKSAGWLWD